MIRIIDEETLILEGREIVSGADNISTIIKERLDGEFDKEEAKKGTIAYRIIKKHNESNDDRNLKLKFDSITSHDITYVSIIQTARASGMKEFSIPYVLTNCHNSLCAVGGTINEDDHKFALSAAKKYGGIYVPSNLAVIHSFNKEMMAKSGNMILGSDSHTRYGALGTMGVGEGGGELVKQLLNQTYDMKTPKVVAVLLKGKPCYGVGPHDVALTIIKAVYDNGFVKNKIMEFIGEGIAALPIEYRNSIDIMTTETTCWSSIWETDNEVKEYYKVHGRSDGYKQLKPAAATVYDGVVEVNLSDIKPSIALPFHPSNVFTIEDLNNNAEDIFRKVEKDSMEIFESNDVKIDLLGKIKLGKIHIDQGIIVGCSGGTFDNITAAADILRGKSTGNDSFSMSIYPESQPTYMELVKNGSVADLIGSGVLIKPAFCGPCFGAGDTPANNELSIRHATRNFPNRDGSKPTEGQSTMVALMDARSIAATAINGGILAGADEINAEYTNKKFFFNTSIYDKKVYNGWKKPQESLELVYGPNIKDWPKMPALTDDIIIKVVAYISDPVTTTDELIPSGETASYRSNPMRLAEFTLSRKDPSYVRKAKVVQEYELLRENGSNPAEKFKEIEKVYNIIKSIKGFEEINPSEIGIGSTIYANKPGDGSAREQAASCQRVLGAWANIAREYATKRYKSNLLNWGIIPFILENGQLISNEDYIFVPGIKNAISKGEDRIKGYVLKDDVYQIDLILEQLTDEEKEILISGSLINFKKLQKGDG